MIGPNELYKLDDHDNKYSIKDMIQDIDRNMKRFHRWYPWEQSIIDYEVSKSMRNRIAQEYIKAGWRYVYHATTTERNERPGLTIFLFSMDKLEGKCANRSWEVSAEDCTWIPEVVEED